MSEYRRIFPPDDYDGLLNREYAAAAIKAQMGRAYEVLYEELKFGLGLFDRVRIVRGDEEYDTRVADTAHRLLWLYLEALDACDCLIRQGAVGPAHAQVRAMIDVGFQLLYVLKRNDDRIAAAYTTQRRRRSLAAAKMLVAGGERRKEVIAEARRTKHLNAEFIAFLESLPDTAAEVERLNKSLSGERWAEANAELERLQDPERWFKAFGGPNDLKVLAREVGMELWHRLIYSPWSPHLHGGTPERAFTPDGDSGEVTVRALRSPTGWQVLVTTGHNLNLEIFRAVIAHFREGEERNLNRWYREVVRPLLAGVSLSGQPQTPAPQ